MDITDTHAVKKRGRKQKPAHEKATADLKAYHKEYHKNRTPEYFVKENKRRKSVAIRQTYNIDENVAEKFKNDLGNIVRIHELIKDLEDGSWELYLSNRHHCRFEKKT